MENFMDEDEEEILTDNDVIEMDENELMYSDMYTFSSEESNQAAETDAVDQPVEVNFNFTPEQTKLFNLFSLENHVKDLLSKKGTGDLQTCLHNHWRVYVPLCFNALDTPTKNLIDTDSTRVLLKPLEAYIANTIDSEKYLNQLKELDDPPVICGKVFKAGEPSYFCRDCGSDPTCVLCSACFRKSKHRDHRYIMMTSGGGGYCDCGDPEAWKSHPNCEIHMPREKTFENEERAEDYQNKLPSDLKLRARELFTFLLEYVFEVLSVEGSEELPSHLKDENSVDDYVTMLYNDEVHSYEQVVNTLKKVLLIDERKSFDYAAIVDKEGRSAIKRDKKNVCFDIKNAVEANMSGPLSNPLQTKVFHHSLVASQYFAEKILIWLQKICDYSSARSILHQFYISMFFMDPYWKRQFAILYTKVIENIFYR